MVKRNWTLGCRSACWKCRGLCCFCTNITCRSTKINNNSNIPTILRVPHEEQSRTTPRGGSSSTSMEMGLWSVGRGTVGTPGLTYLFLPLPNEDSECTSTIIINKNDISVYAILVKVFEIGWTRSTTTGFLVAPSESIHAHGVYIIFIIRSFVHVPSLWNYVGQGLANWFTLCAGLFFSSNSRKSMV